MAALGYGGPGWLWDCSYGGPWLLRAVTVPMAQELKCRGRVS